MTYLKFVIQEESVTSTCSPPPSQVVEMHSADAPFIEGEKLTMSSVSSSVSSTSTFVSLESSNLCNEHSSF